MGARFCPRCGENVSAPFLIPVLKVFFYVVLGAWILVLLLFALAKVESSGGTFGPFGALSAIGFIGASVLSLVLVLLLLGRFVLKSVRNAK